MKENKNETKIIIYKLRKSDEIFHKKLNTFKWANALFCVPWINLNGPSRIKKK